jgi:hypothetical protein
MAERTNHNLKESRRSADIAHSPQKKAQALAMLMTGDTPNCVAKQLGIPLTACKRWNKEATQMLCAALPDIDFSVLGEIVNDVAKTFPGLFDKR